MFRIGDSLKVLSLPLDLFPAIVTVHGIDGNMISCSIILGKLELGTVAKVLSTDGLNSCCFFLFFFLL